MPDSIDPYRDWLDISDPTRPLDHYRLLGLDPLEPDPERIENAGMIQMGKVLRYDSGPYAPLVQRVYEELEDAVRCLSNPETKRRYDDSLNPQTADELAEHLLLESPDPHGELLREVSATPAESAVPTSPAATPAPLAGQNDQQPLASAVAPRSSLATESAPRPDGPSKKQPKRAQRRRSSTEETGSLAPGVWKAGLLAVCAPLLTWFCMTWLAPGVSPESADAYVHLLEDGDPTTRIEGCAEIGRLGVTPMATDALLKLLRGEQDVQVRRAAADALSRCYLQLGASRSQLADVAATEADSQTKQLLEWTVTASQPK